MLSEMDGLKLGLMLTEMLGETDGLMLADGEALGETDGLKETDIEGLIEGETDALGD